MFRYIINEFSNFSSYRRYKVLIKDPQYKTMLDDLIQNYNNNNNNALLNDTPTTERDIEVKRITDEILTNVKLKEIKQQIR